MQVPTAVTLATVAILWGCGPGMNDVPTTFAAATANLPAQKGFLPIYPDAPGGRVLVALPAPDPESHESARAIYIAYLRTGLGSNPVGLDRGKNGGPHLVRFEVRGGNVYLVAENTRFTAATDRVAERVAVAESFGRSILWSGKVLATAEDGRVLVDLASFLASDVLGIAQELKDAEQGEFELAADRSFANPDATLVFPDNVELEAFLTFISPKPGTEVRATAAVGNAVTFTLHHSFVRLPPDGFERRAFDPRMGAIAFRIADYAAALDEPIERPSTLRFRLHKQDPQAERSPPVKPIVFYVDRGAPEPVRQALVEGAGWWAEAFEAAGFEDAFRVELLPQDAHPLDARYNVIQWVHRKTRGWSYGSPIYDPRTGEIIKAVVTLGSLRVRHDRRIFEGLLDAARSGTGAPDDPVVLALARLRQLAAHEVGHALGFPHNMGASVNDRASVMDYPPPRVSVASSGDIDVSNAYAVGIGPWDRATARYLYSDFPEGMDEATALEAIVYEARSAGLVFVTDRDSQPLSTANPAGALWDDGADPVAALETALEVRGAALADFGPTNLPAGTPLSELREVIVPIYYWHRYAVDAAAKLVGGYRFSYAVAGDPDGATVPVAAHDQRRALAALVRAADADILTLPDTVPGLIAPRHESWFDSPSPEAITGDMGPIFDEPAAAAIGAGLVYDALLDPARASRLAAAGDNTLTLGETLATAAAGALARLDGVDPRRRANAHAIVERYVTAVIDLARSKDASAAAALQAEVHLGALSAKLAHESGSTRQPLAALSRRIERFLARPADAAEPGVAHPAPPGSPIGHAMFAHESEWHSFPAH